MASAKKQTKKPKKEKSERNKRKHKNYIIIFDGTIDEVSTSKEKNQLGVVEKNLKKLGDIEALFFAPKRSVRLWSKKKVSSKHVKNAVREGLDTMKGSAFIVERPSGKVWSWPSKPPKKAAKSGNKWAKRH